MARNFLGFLAKNKPVWVSEKTNIIPGANWLIYYQIWTQDFDIKYEGKKSWLALTTKKKK